MLIDFFHLFIISTYHIISSQFFWLLPVTDYPSTISTSSYHLIPVLSDTSYPQYLHHHIISSQFSQILPIHNICTIISSYPSSLRYFLSTISAPSYHLIPVLSDTSHPQYLHHHIISSQFSQILPIHNICTIISSHPCSLGCFLLPIIHPQFLCHHTMSSSQFSRLPPVTYNPSTISTPSYHLIPVLLAASCLSYRSSIHNRYIIISCHPSSLGCFHVAVYLSTISTSLYHLIPVLSAASCYQLSIHRLYLIISPHPRSLGCFLLPIIHPQSLRHHIISSQFSQILPIHNICTIISSYPSSLRYFLSTISAPSYHLIPVLSDTSHPQYLHHHIISSQFSQILPIHNICTIISSHPSPLRYFLSTISAPSYHLIPVLSDTSHPQFLHHHIISSQFSQILPIHNICTIISSHPSSLRYFPSTISAPSYHLIPVLSDTSHPQSLHHHIISSQFSQILPMNNLCTIISSHPSSLRYFPSTISAQSYHLIPVPATTSSYLLSIHNLYITLSSPSSSLGYFLLPIFLHTG